MQFNDFSSEELRNLLCLKKIIESKPKDELLKFLDMEDPGN